MTLISTPLNLIPTRLMQLLQREGIPYQVECWSFRWWHCPNCGCQLPSCGRVDTYRACCAGCSVTSECVKRTPGLYVAVGPLIEPELPPR